MTSCNKFGGYLFLLFDDFADSRVVELRMDVALHHGSSLVVLDVALPTLSRHPNFLRESLLAEVAKREIVGVGHQILHFSTLHFL